MRCFKQPPVVGVIINPPKTEAERGRRRCQAPAPMTRRSGYQNEVWEEGVGGEGLGEELEGLGLRVRERLGRPWIKASPAAERVTDSEPMRKAGPG